MSWPTHDMVDEIQRLRAARPQRKALLRRRSTGAAVAINTDRIDGCVLAPLLLGRQDGQRVWKSFGWDAMDRLHKKGLISEPVGRAKSVVLTNDGLENAERLFRDLFATNP
jgi:hypothetical protein